MKNIGHLFFTSLFAVGVLLLFAPSVAFVIALVCALYIVTLIFTCVSPEFREKLKDITFPNRTRPEDHVYKDYEDYEDYENPENTHSAANQDTYLSIKEANEILEEFLKDMKNNKFIK